MFQDESGIIESLRKKHRCYLPSTSQMCKSRVCLSSNMTVVSKEGTKIKPNTKNRAKTGYPHFKQLATFGHSAISKTITGCVCV